MLSYEINDDVKMMIGMLAKGYYPSLIARKMMMLVPEVHTRLRSIRKRTGIITNCQLVYMAVMEDLI